MFITIQKLITMCQLKDCTFCPQGKPHYCRLCQMTDDHFTRNCPNKLLADRLHTLLVNNRVPSEDEAKEISIPWEDMGHSFWFDQNDLGEHFDYFYDLQKMNNGKSMYGDTVRFANNNIELLMNDRWKIFVEILLDRLQSNK